MNQRINDQHVPTKLIQVLNITTILYDYNTMLLLLLVTSGSSAASSWQLGHHKVSSI